MISWHYNQKLSAIYKIDLFVFSSRGHLTAVEYMFKKYIEKLRMHDPACPLCHRPFDEQTEVDELISEVNLLTFNFCPYRCIVVFSRVLLCVDDSFNLTGLNTVFIFGLFL